LLVHQVKERLHLITSFYLAYNELFLHLKAQDNSEFFEGVNMNLVDWLRQYAPEDEQTETFLRGFLSIQRTFSPPESTLAFFLTSSPLNNIRPKKPRKNVVS
jgi:hypothetical protein